MILQLLIARFWHIWIPVQHLKAGLPECFVPGFWSPPGCCGLGSYAEAGNCWSTWNSKVCCSMMSSCKKITLMSSELFKLRPNLLRWACRILLVRSERSNLSDLLESSTSAGISPCCIKSHVFARFKAAKDLAFNVFFCLDSGSGGSTATVSLDSVAAGSPGSWLGVPAVISTEAGLLTGLASERSWSLSFFSFLLFSPSCVTCLSCPFSHSYLSCLSSLYDLMVLAYCWQHQHH